MAGPFHIEIVAKIERHRDLTAYKLIDNGAIVDAANFGELAVAVIEKLAALLHHSADVDGAHSVILFRQLEIVARLLMRGIDFKEDDIPGIVRADNRPTQERVVFISVQAAG